MITFFSHLPHLYCVIDKHILSAPLSIRDLAHVDQRLAKSAQDIMECDDVEALYLDFTTAVWMLGVTDIVELKENGSNIPVTNDNREVSFFCFLKLEI